MSEFLSAAASLTQQSPYLELYSLDVTNQGGGVIYWTPGPAGSASVVMNGITYTPVPIEASGFEWNGQGALPTPKLKVSNASGDVMGLLQMHNDALGGVVTRTRTFYEFTDGQPGADPTAVAMPDIYRVERKSHADKSYVELELAAFTDVQGRMLPFRVVLRDACTRTYRTWNATTGNFIQGQCPYTGGAYFDVSDTAVTDPSKDVCSRKVRGCSARFGQTANLPTWGFPGVALTNF